ncbi:hypothetical protein Peur_054695 [Populus x canadensis]
MGSGIDRSSQFGGLGFEERCRWNEGPSVHFDASQFDGDDLSGVLLTHPYGDNIWKGSLFNEYINLGSEDKVKNEIDFHDHVTVNKTGVSLAFAKDMYANDYTVDDESTEEETGLE